MERVKLLVPAPIVLILALAFLAGACSDRKPSLNGVLALIDSGSNRAGPELHVRAAALAFGTEARLRVLKRASLLDDTAYADVAAVFDRSGSLTEPVALGVFDAYMRDRRYREASRLFPRSLSAAEHPFLVAELVTASRSTGVFPGLDPRDYLAAAEAASIPALYVEGAIGALLQGQASVARQLLKEAVSRGVHVPAELLWDAGCHEALADSLPADGDPDSIEFAAAAAYLSGLEDRAAELCLYLLD